MPCFSSPLLFFLSIDQSILFVSHVLDLEPYTLISFRMFHSTTTSCVSFFLFFHSTESGQDNPFRPDGDLSREADELVELLKGGRPISEVLKSKEEVQRAEISGADLAASPESRNASSPSSPKGTDAADGGGSRTNGNVTEQESGGKRTSSGASSPGAVEVQRAVVAPVTGAESQVEHVVIKKKSKCQCCVIQ